MRENHSKIINDVQHQTDGPPGWLITFNDLLTLLMVFFVLLFAMGNINVQQSEKLVGSLQSALGKLQGGKKNSIEVNKPLETIEQRDGKDTESIPMIVEGLLEEAQHVMDDLASLPEITVLQTPKGISITLSDKILFQSGVSELRTEGYPILNKVIPLLQNNQFAIRVEGHTDNVSIRSARFPSNWELSVSRAVHVLKYLVEYGKILPQRLSAVGYGDSKPIFPNDTPANREKNRRVEIILEMMDS